MSFGLSPIQFSDSQLLHFSFDVRPSLGIHNEERQPEKESELNTSISHHYFNQNGRIVCNLAFSLRWDVRLKDDPSKILANIECTMGVAAHCSENAADDRKMIEAALFTNAIAFIWARIRVYIENVSSESPVGKMTLPAIDPNSFRPEDNQA